MHSFARSHASEGCSQGKINYIQGSVNPSFYFSARCHVGVRELTLLWLLVRRHASDHATPAASMEFYAFNSLRQKDREKFCSGSIRTADGDCLAQRMAQPMSKR